MTVVAFAFASSTSFAIGLGTPTLQSGLGDPLRLSLPVSLQPDEDVGCIAVRPKGDDLPSVYNTRSQVIRSGGATRIEITSPQPVNEPAIGLIVSVGCGSPVSREFILFLDPPVLAPALPVAAAASAAPQVEPPRRATAPRRAAPRKSQAATSTPPKRPASPSPRPPRVRERPTPSTPTEAPVGTAGKATPPPVAATPKSTGPQRDRLTIAPNEPSTAGAPSAPIAGTQPAAPTASAVPPGGTGVPVPPSASSTPDAAAALPVDAGSPAAREQLLLQQQADLQRQIKQMSDQIAALRIQTKGLAERNQVLQDTMQQTSTFAPWLVWILIALAVLAILVAGWMAWRYVQLRRSVEGSAWWTNNTMRATTTAEAAAGAEALDGLAPLDPGTRIAPLPPISRPPAKTPVQRTSVADPRASSQKSASSIESRANVAPASTPSASSVERARATGRDARYPAAIETDFTVSDIEAAMATVRVVSPPRDPARQVPLEDSDFAPLGGPTLPSPFTEPPPPVSRSNKVVERDGEDIGKFVDLAIPPMPTHATSPAPFAAPPVRILPPPVESPMEESEPLDFKLDIPNTFDPLSTDSLKTTVVDRADPPGVVDFELPSTPTSLDFELPSMTSIAPLGVGDARFAEPPARQGATALDDLFSPLATNPGIDTILNLDEREGSPLSTTEIDGLVATSVEGAVDESVQSSTRYRMARFADLMNQVDELSVSDPLRAITQLRQYVLRDEQIPTLLWLRLFELYKVVDKKPVYGALAEHFARRYHRPMIDWTQTFADRVPQTPLSAISELDRRIESLWGKEEGLELLRSLLCDRDQDDAMIFNAVLQRDLLDAAKVFPVESGASTGDGATNHL